LGAFVAAAVGYVLIAFLWGWYKRRSAEADATNGGMRESRDDTAAEDR
jgi:hypothetical protein